MKAGHPPEPLGGPDVHTRHAYGIKYSGPKRFKDQVRGALNPIRKQFEELKEGDVVWEPYEGFLGEDLEVAVPQIVGDRHLWYARVPMINFWMVEFHYPDRVMRQFGRMQLVPPPLPEPWEIHEKDMKHEHTVESHKERPDWPAIHYRHIEVKYCHCLPKK